VPRSSSIFGPRWRLRHDSAIPAHAQIEDQLADRIASGELEVGRRLPSERDLADELSVSRMTVRQALASLAARGQIERGVGRGTFVSARKVEHDHSRVAGFTEQMQEAGLEAGATVRSAEERPATQLIAAALGIAAGDPMARIERVRSGAGVALTLEDSWVPLASFPGLLSHSLEGSLYALMRDEYGLEPVRAVERLEPVLARPHEAEALGVPEGSPLMLVERVAYAADGTAVEWARDRHRGDRARFVVEVAAGVPSHA
jgi:GntR family transcriptional regulator